MIDPIIPADAQIDPLLKLYAVGDGNGKYLGKHGWTSDLSQARIYAKPGGARNRVTYYATNDPQYGILKLIELHVTRAVAKSETERVTKSQNRKERREASEGARNAKHQLEMAQRDMEDAQKRMAKYGGRI